MSVTLREVVDASPPNVTRCKFGRFVDDLPEDDRELLISLLALPVAEAGNTWLKARLREEGHIVADRTFRRHRYRECSCYGITQKDYTT